MQGQFHKHCHRVYSPFFRYQLFYSSYLLVNVTKSITNFLIWMCLIQGLHMKTITSDIFTCIYWYTIVNEKDNSPQNKMLHRNQIVLLVFTVHSCFYICIHDLYTMYTMPVTYALTSMRTHDRNKCNEVNCYT